MFPILKIHYQSSITTPVFCLIFRVQFDESMEVVSISIRQICSTVQMNVHEKERHQ